LPLYGLDDPAIAVAEIAVEKLGQKIEIAFPLPIVKKYALAVIEFKDRFLAFLDGPGHEHVLAW
jgi:hypothetical protein